MSESLLQSLTAEDLKRVSNQHAIRERNIPWAQYHHALIMSEEELRMWLSAIERPTLEEQSVVVKDHQKEFATLLVKLLGRIDSDDALQFVLLFCNDMIDTVPSLAHVFVSNKEIDALAPFSRLLNRQDSFSIDQTAQILAKLFCADKNKEESIALEAFLDWLTLQLRGRSKVSVALAALTIMLRRQDYRLMFHSARGSSLIPPLLRSVSSNVTALYHAVLCLWLLTFNSEIALSLRDCHVVALIHSTVQRVNREKVLRLCLGCLKNLLSVGTFSREMIAVGLYSSLSSMTKRKFGDEDIPELCTFLIKGLDEQIVVLSSFEHFYQQVMSGRLEWTPVHKNEKFWRENMDKFEANNFAIVKELLSIVKSILLETEESDIPEEDFVSASIAVFDLGEFSRYHPRGKKVLRDIGAKNVIMGLMSHGNEGVRLQSLMATQKMMVQNWEFVGRT